ncbi:MAG: PaREP1 family protein [Sulfolobales archaeon]
MSVHIVIPRKLYERLASLGVDVESKIIEILLNELKLDPREELEVYIELAERFLYEGKNLVDKDPVQASEKLYKAAEESVKALVIIHRVEEIIARVRERGRWRSEDLFNAVTMLRSVYGDEIRRLWNTAWTLHVWGFHEAKATKEYVEASVRDVELLVELVSRALKTQS